MEALHVHGDSFRVIAIGSNRLPSEAHYDASGPGSVWAATVASPN